MNPALKVVLVAVGYLAGSIPFGVVLTRLLTGKDVRKVGSGNIGASNVTRAAGKAAGIMTLVLDAAKAAAPMLVARALLAGEDPATVDAWVTVVGFAAFVGHIYPVWLRFKGGKGVATFIGVVFGIHWILGLGTGATWIIIAFFFRYSSLASLVSAAFAPVYYLLADRVAWYADARIATALFVMALLLAWRHRENISRLVAGKESKLGQKKSA
jgi:glycerol-3-phosphate acyltransferase PlsY